MAGRVVPVAAIALLLALGVGPGVSVAADDDIVGPFVRLVAESPRDDFRTDLRVVDELTSPTVLRVNASGFPSFARASAQQCMYDPGRRCGNRLPVQTDESGRATFQYLVADDFTGTVDRAGGCRPDRNRCTVRIETIGSDQVAEIDTVFGGEARPLATIDLTPADEIVDGSLVTVDVSGYPPAASFEAVLCRAPHVGDPRFCGSPGPSTSMTVGSDGTATATLTVTEGVVGSESSKCTRRTTCGVTLVSDDMYVRAATPAVTFAGRAGPEYDRTRLASGLGIAVALVALAIWWMTTGEWDPPQEAAARDLEAAEYADLDALVAAQEEREKPTAVSPDLR